MIGCAFFFISCQLIINDLKMNTGTNLLNCTMIYYDNVLVVDYDNVMIVQYDMIEYWFCVNSAAGLMS